MSAKNTQCPTLSSDNKTQCPECGCTFEVKKKKAKKATDPRVSELITFYYEVFKGNHHEPPHINGAACGDMLKRLLKEKTQTELEGFIKDYVVCNDAFLKEAGYPFLLLPNYIQKAAVKNKQVDSIPEWKRGPV